MSKSSGSASPKLGNVAKTSLEPWTSRSLIDPYHCLIMMMMKQAHSVMGLTTAESKKLVTGAKDRACWGIRNYLNPYITTCTVIHHPPNCPSSPLFSPRCYIHLRWRFTVIIKIVIITNLSLDLFQNARIICGHQSSGGGRGEGGPTWSLGGLESGGRCGGRRRVSAGVAPRSSSAKNQIARPKLERKLMFSQSEALSLLLTFYLHDH